MPIEDCRAALADLAVESWRFANDYGRLISKLDANEQSRFTHKLHFFFERLRACLAKGELTLVDLKGQPYEAGTAAEVLNLHDFPEGDELIIEAMIEPIVMGASGIVKTGKAMVKARR